MTEQGTAEAQVHVKEIVMDGAGLGTVTLSDGRQLGGVLGATVLADTGQMVSVLLRIQCPQVRIGPGQKVEQLDVRYTAATSGVEPNTN